MSADSLPAKQTLAAKRFRSGFSLIEMVLAIAVVAVTFVGIMGLLGTGLANDQASTQQTVATNLAAAILADLRSTPTYATKSTRYGVTLPTSPASAGTPFSTSTNPLSGVTAAVLYFDNSPTFISLTPATVPSNATYVANVYMARVAYIGVTSPQSTDLARIVVSWPAQTPTGIAPAGSVDVVSQFMLH